MLEPKQLTCMNEELCIEIVKPKDTAQDLIISVSITRTYVIPPLDIIDQNGDRTQASRDAQLLRSCVI